MHRHYILWQCGTASSKSQQAININYDKILERIYLYKQLLGLLRGGKFCFSHGSMSNTKVTIQAENKALHLSYMYQLDCTNVSLSWNNHWIDKFL